MFRTIKRWMLIYQSTIAFAVVTFLFALVFLCSGCARGKATRYVYKIDADGVEHAVEKRTIEINQYESRAKIGGDTIEVKRSGSLLDFLIPAAVMRLIDVQVGPSGEAIK